MRIKGNRFYWMVGESKFGSSQLATTTDGNRQLSSGWTVKRLKQLGKRYQALENLEVSFRKIPTIPPKAQLDIPLSSGKTVAFWQDKSENWFFAGTKEELSEARSMAARMGRDLVRDDCNLRVRLFHIEAAGNDLKITLFEVKPEEVTTIARLKPKSEFIVKGLLGKNISDKELKRLIASALKNKLPHLSEGELKQITDDIARKYRNGDLLNTPRPVWQEVALQSLLAAGIAGTIDLSFQLLSSRKVEFSRVALTTASVAAGTTGGQVLSIVLLKTQLGNQSIRSVASLLHLGTGMTRAAISGLGGGLATSLLMAYGGFALGLHNAKAAQRMAVNGMGGTIAGAATGLGIPALVANFATCGTGTAISSLSGAAAAKATMAWLGFGTLANGGLGIAGGALLLGGYMAIAGMAASTAISYIYKLHDESEQRKYSLLCISFFRNHAVWIDIAQRDLEHRLTN